MRNILIENKILLIKDLRANKGQLVERGIPKNPRRITKEKYNLLLQSLDKSNLTQIRPLDVIEHEGKFIVLSGNQRLRALKELKKIKEVPCNILRDDLEPETYRQIVLQANTNYGEHDDDLLANEWDAVELHEWGYDLPDWENEKIEEETQGDDDVPESAPPITVKGDLYALGEHRLLCGDSTMIDDVEKLMDGEKADMVYTDPPYSQSFNGGGGLSNKFDYRKDAIKKISEFNPENFLQVITTVQKNKNMYIWTSKNLLFNYLEYINNIKSNFDILVWSKNNPVPAKNNTYLSDIEFCVFIRDGEVYFNNEQPFEEYKKVMTENVSNNTHGHPTQKYLWMIERALNISSKQYELIIDPFLGSGSTLIACEKTKRRCYGMELDAKYCDIIVKRYIEFCVKNNKEAKVYRNGELISNDVFLVG